MRNTWIALCLLVAIPAQAQLKEGRIIYERTMTLPTRVFNADPAATAQIPRSRTDQFELLFSSKRSLWQFLPSATNDDPGTFSGNGFVMRFGGTNDIIFHDFEKGTRVDQREVMERNFIISDTINKPSWKITDETKTILNYTAQKALGQRVIMRTQMSMENGEMKRQVFPDTTHVIAWFSTDIPVPIGPEAQGQLPGAILEMEINKGQILYKALEVFSKVNTAKIREPQDGKKVTAAEFTKEREQLIEEMRNNMPKGNGNTIHITN